MESEETTTKTCPACAEVILAKAIKCRYCGEFLDGRASNPQRETVETRSRGTPVVADVRAVTVHGRLFVLAAILLVSGGAIFGVGFAMLEPSREIDIYDTSGAREILPGIRNDIGAVLQNSMRSSDDRSRSLRAFNRAEPWLYFGGTVAGVGGVVLLAALLAWRNSRKRQVGSAAS